MRNYAVKTVDEYINLAPKEAQGKLTELRKVVRSVVPNAEEGISWGVPFYKYHGLLAGFSSFKNHVSFGFSDQLQAEVRQALEKQGYATGSKTIQIKFDQAVPAAIIEQILTAKIKKNQAKSH